VAKQVAIRWSAHGELSAAHAAYVVATGARCTDPKTEALLIEPVTEVNNRLVSSSIDVGAFWQSYLVERLRDTEMNVACAMALMSSGCSELQVEQTTKAISGRLSDARLAFMQRFPKLAEQLELRARPLREKWDTYGPGLLRDVGRQIWDNSPPENWWMPRVQGWLVQPVRGGDGGFDVHSERFWIEAMLTDADPLVPEVLRIAWLVTRMAIERHIRERSGDLSLSRAWSLVSVPLVLTAAAELELIRGGDLPIARAMELWQIGDAQIAERLRQWWQQLRQTPQPLPVALKALDRLLKQAGDSLASRPGVA
jgi:hypothetical protein